MERNSDTSVTSYIDSAWVPYFEARSQLSQLEFALRSADDVGERHMQNATLAWLIDWWTFGEEHAHSENSKLTNLMNLVNFIEFEFEISALFGTEMLTIFSILVNVRRI